MSESDNIPLYAPAPGPSTTPVQWKWPQVGTPGGAEIGAAGSAASAFASLVQGIQAQKRAKAIAGYNAEVVDANALAQAQADEIAAQQLERNAQMARDDQRLVAQAEAWREARQQAQQQHVLGQTRALIAASGLLMTGSPMAVYEETIHQQTFDVMAQRYQAAIQGRAAGEQADQATYGAVLARHGAAERIRVGQTSAALVRANVDETQVGAGLMKAGATLTEGVAHYRYNVERRKESPSLLS